VNFALERVTAGYGESVVLRDVSIVVPEGAVVALLGANGAGKTTLLRVASGLLAPRAGRLLVDGSDVTGRSVQALAAGGVCHVPEGRGIFPSLSVREHLVLFAPPGRTDDAIDRVAQVFPILGERLGQVAGTLSGGQQQMLALARAYLADAHLILLDEVSMGLAPRLVDEIFGFLGHLRTTSASLLLVEQYVDRALEMADYVYILERGRIAFAGEPSELDSEDVMSHYLGGTSGRQSGRHQGAIDAHH
jgi:branched-chain amino acid transport system ATP-binding protein